MEERVAPLQLQEGKGTKRKGQKKERKGKGKKEEAKICKRWYTNNYVELMINF